MKSMNGAMALKECPSPTLRLAVKMMVRVPESISETQLQPPVNIDCERQQ